MRVRWLLLGGLGVVMAAVGSRAFAGSAPAKVAPAQPARAVRVARVEHGAIAHPIHATGVVRAKKEIDLAFLLGGEITWIGVDVGAHVKKGQILARVDPTPASTDAIRAREASKKATRDLARVRSLAGSGSLPTSNLEDAETGAAVAAEQARAADFALQHVVIVAPEDGVIDARDADPGEIASAGRPILRLSGRSRGDVVRVSLADRDVLGLELGRAASVTLDADPSHSMKAVISQVASAATPGVGTFEVELTLAEQSSALRTGLTAKVTIERAVTPGAIVPISSLVPGDQEGASVLSVENGAARRLPVRVAFFEGERVGLVDALAGVDAVATDGSAGLADGALVEVVP